MSKRLVVALSGGVGGAKLALGLSRILPADELLVVANTGDDFEHLGLSISPDIDTLTYVLADIDNPVTGWGRRDETWSFMDSIGPLGGEDWFRLGDRDLALHVERTRRLRLGQTLSEVTADICRRLGIGARVVPMSDDRVRTRVRGDAGWIDFQDYFVRQQCRPVVHELAFEGVMLARPHADITAALRSGDVRAVIVCPSNPFISVEPILAIPGMRDAIKASGAPVVAVSPIIGGRAVKGPTAKMMRELGLEASAAGVAARYGDLLDGYIVDHADADGIGNVGARVTIAKTLMTSLQDRETLARVDARRGGRTGLAAMSDIWAVIPVKEFDGAKHRLSGLLSPPERRLLAETMLTDMLEAVAGSRLLAGVMIVTLDPRAAALGEKVGARIVTEGARDGHTGSVNAGRRLLAGEGRGGMITMPGDIPATRAGEIDAVLSAHLAAPSFTISPAHDDLGSNAVVCSPPESVPLRFGDNSYFPHLDAARLQGIEPTVVRQPGIAMDIDHPVDLALFLRMPQSAGTRTRALLDNLGVAALLAERGIA